MNNSPETKHFPFASLPPEQQTAIAVQCTAATCVNAKAALEKARNQVLIHGEALNDALDKRNSLARTARAVWIFFLILTALLISVFFVPFAGVLLAYTITALAAAALVSAIALSIQVVGAANAVEQARVRRRTARRQFDETAGEIITHCPEYCWGDLAQPQCQLQ